jgi:hypothetical protein
MRSAWMMSVGDMDLGFGPGDSGVRDDPAAPFDRQKTLPHHSPRRNQIPSEAMPLPPLDFAKPPSGRRDSITDTVPPLERREPRSGVPAWVVVAMLLLVVIAAAAGFWFGRRPH